MLVGRKALYKEFKDKNIGLSIHYLISRLGKKGYIHTLKKAIAKHAYPEHISRTRWYGLVFGDDLYPSQYSALAYIPPDELSKSTLKSLKSKGLIGVGTMTLAVELLDREDIKQELASLIEIKDQINWDQAPRF